MATENFSSQQQQQQPSSSSSTGRTNNDRLPKSFYSHLNSKLDSPYKDLSILLPSAVSTITTTTTTTAQTPNSAMTLDNQPNLVTSGPPTAISEASASGFDSFSGMVSPDILNSPSRMLSDLLSYLTLPSAASDLPPGNDNIVIDYKQSNGLLELPADVLNSLLASNDSRRFGSTYAAVIGKDDASVENINRIPGYFIKQSLAKGNFAKVFLGQHLASGGSRVAIKRLAKRDLKSHDSNQRVFREVMVHKSLRHPNICRLLEVVDSDNYIYFVLSFCANGELFDKIIRAGRLDEQEGRRLFRQLVSAIHYCHSNNIVHRDLKLENLMLDSDDNLQLIDFGLTTVYSAGILLKTNCGSPEYAAPEMISSQAYWGPSVDVWSMGVILFTMLTGQLPFNDIKLSKMYSKIATARYQWPADIEISDDAKDLISKIFVVSPTDRISLTDIAKHPWVTKGYSESPYRQNEATSGRKLTRSTQDLFLMASPPTANNPSSLSLLDSALKSFYESLQMDIGMQNLSVADIKAVIKECARIYNVAHEEIEIYLRVGEPSPVYATFYLLSAMKSRNNLQTGQKKTTPRLMNNDFENLPHLLGNDLTADGDLSSLVNRALTNDRRAPTSPTFIPEKSRILSMDISKRFNR